jgi:Na+-transporting NADH:ubiquinone oxidoreductase subunit NqrE
MDTKKLENLVTKTGVGLLFFLTFVGIIFVFDVAFDLDLFSNSMKKAAGVFLGIVCVFVVCSVLVSLMLNVSRIANSIEDISKKRVENEVENKTV